MIEATLLVFLCCLVLALCVWNVMVHRWLGQGKAQEAAHRAQTEATMQELARRLSDLEELRCTASSADPHDEQNTAPQELAALAPHEAMPRSGASSPAMRPAEAELLAKLSRYRQQQEFPESSSGTL